MRGFGLAILVLTVAGAPALNASAFAASDDDRSAVCPARDRDEALSAFRSRTHHYCEVRWRGMVAAHDTGGMTHDQYINVCARKCYGDMGDMGGHFAGDNLGYAFGAANAAALGYAISSVTGDSSDRGGGNSRRPISP